MNKYISGIFILFFAASSFAQLDNYSFKRKINKVEKENYYKITLHPDVLARSKSNLSDLRIYNVSDNDTTEVPYLMDWLGSKTTEVSIPFELINDTYNEKCCSYVTLKFPKKQTINQIKLNVRNANFDKRLQIEGSNDNKEWFTIKEHLRIVRFQNATEDYSYTTLNFPSAEFTYFRLKFDDDGSSRVEITEAYAFENQLVKGNYDELKIVSKKQTENKKEKTSEVIVEFALPYLVNYLTLKSSTKNDFYRNVNVYASSGTITTEKGELENWYLINTSVFSSDDDNVIHCNNVKTRKLKFEIINHDNEPIDISEVKAYAEQSQLVASLPLSENLYLAYGKENDNIPNYDLVHFRNKIPATISNLEYGIEEARIVSTTKSEQLIKSKMWLWLVMGIVLVVIAYFAMTMLKKEQGDSK